MDRGSRLDEIQADGEQCQGPNLAEDETDGLRQPASQGDQRDEPMLCVQNAIQQAPPGLRCQHW
jgi:hypothetical protein